MTPKEKAEKLFIDFYPDYYDNGLLHKKTVTKQIIQKLVDEIEKAIDFDWMEVQNLDSQHRYWQQVKQEIEKL